MQMSLFSDNDQTKPPTAPPRNDVMAGDAAEALVVFKLLNLGFDAHDARRDAPYDVGIDLRDGRICRVQVKACSKPIRSRWNYRFVRGNPRTGSGSYPYADTDYDITACVALPLERVIFCPGVHATMRFSTADFLRADGEGQSWQRAFQTFNRKR